MKLRHLLLERKAMTNLDSLLKSRGITLPTKVYIIKAMVFPVVMYGCETWTIKKDKCQRIDALELWCWRRLLRVPWTARRSNQSILKEACGPRSFQESSPAPQFQSIKSSVLSLLYGSTPTSIHDYQKNHSFDSTELCRQNDVSAF